MKLRSYSSQAFRHHQLLPMSKTRLPVDGWNLHPNPVPPHLTTFRNTPSAANLKTKDKQTRTRNTFFLGYRLAYEFHGTIAVPVEAEPSRPLPTSKSNLLPQPVVTTPGARDGRFRRCSFVCSGIWTRDREIFALFQCSGAVFRWVFAEATRKNWSITSRAPVSCVMFKCGPGKGSRTIFLIVQ